jgi:hypothetical protein
MQWDFLSFKACARHAFTVYLLPLLSHIYFTDNLQPVPPEKFISYAGKPQNPADFAFVILMTDGLKMHVEPAWAPGDALVDAGL